VPERKPIVRSLDSNSALDYDGTQGLFSSSPLPAALATSIGLALVPNGSCVMVNVSGKRAGRLQVVLSEQSASWFVSDGKPYFKEKADE
jgi:hypothetical protein